MRLDGPRDLLLSALGRIESSRGFLPAVGGLSCLLTLSMSVPTTAILVPAALLWRQRWRAIAIAGALGSGLGATILLLAFHHLGWAQLHHMFPAMLESAEWRKVMGWTAAYGMPLLFVIAASPLPQTPAIVFLAIARPEAVPVFLAISAGKLVKYGFLCAAAGRLPEPVLRRWGRETRSARGSDDPSAGP